MKRTRKWEFVRQDAIRLAGLGLSPREIAKRLGVNKSSVTRWMASGKLSQKAGKDAKRRAKTLSVTSAGGKTPQAWAAAVKKDYDLNATDEQLVALAKSALAMAHDRNLKPREQLSAMAEFRANVKQLALVARDDEAEGKPGEPKAPAQEAPKRPEIVRRADPRLLVAVK